MSLKYSTNSTCGPSGICLHIVIVFAMLSCGFANTRYSKLHLSFLSYRDHRNFFVQQSGYDGLQKSLASFRFKLKVRTIRFVTDAGLIILLTRFASYLSYFSHQSTERRTDSGAQSKLEDSLCPERLVFLKTIPRIGIYLTFHSFSVCNNRISQALESFATEG